MVSVVGRTTAAAATDRDGRYSLRELPYGPYILSVHSRGFFKSRGRTIQLTTSRISIPEIQLQDARAEKAPVAFTAPVADASVVQVDATRRVWARGISTRDRERDGQRGGAVPVAGHRGRSRRGGGNRVASPSLAAQHPQGRLDRPGLGREPRGRAMVQPAVERRAHADCLLQRASAVGTAEPDDDRVIRSNGRNFQRPRSSQRGVRVRQYPGGGRRVGDARRDDARRPVVVDRRRLV